jgi:cell division initiation protein
MDMLPNDIRQHRFRRGMRGYDTDEVDQFLEHVATVLEDALAARREAELAKERLEHDIVTFRQQEGALKQAVVTVQNAMSQAREATGQELESIRRKAEADARTIIQKAESERQKLESDLHYLRESRRNYMEQFRAFCEAQLRTLDTVDAPAVARSATPAPAPAQRSPEPARLETPPAPPPVADPQPWLPPRAQRPNLTSPHAEREAVVTFPPPLVPAREKSAND